MAKKQYDLKQTPEGAAESKKVQDLALATVPMSQFVSKSAPTDFAGTGFEDLSLPPIIKTKGLQPGNVIIGEIVGFGIYDDGKNIRSALITIHVMEWLPETKTFQRVGQRAAIPVGAVLGRALGAPQNSGKEPQGAIDDIIANGYGPGTILMMRYQGTGKERGDKLNAPHLWDIMAKKVTAVTGEILDTKKKK